MDCVAAEQVDTASEHKSHDVYASKLEQARKSASTLTWLNVLGNTLPRVIVRAFRQPGAVQLTQRHL